MKEKSRDTGILILQAEEIKDYFDFIFNLKRNTDLIWRGQRDSSWTLKTRFDRLLDSLTNEPFIKTIFLDPHLSKFVFNARSRRGSSPPGLEENQWWALGQHNGLATPLLDWTKSPFVALFFAFESPEKSKTNYRAIFGIDRTLIEFVSEEIKKNFKKKNKNDNPPIIEFIEPLSDDIPSLITQNALFTKAPVGITIEDWAKQNWHSIQKAGGGLESFEENPDKVIQIYQILIPDGARSKILNYLDLMNINHLSLFPNIYGASQYANWQLEKFHNVFD